MKTKGLCLMLLFAGLTLRSHAQENAKENEALKKHLIQRIQETNRVHPPVRQKAVQVETSRYNNREKEILAKLNTDDIPASFPWYKPEYTNDQYTILMNKWYNDNPAYIKKESSNEQK